MADVSNTEDILDSRQIEDRIDELESELDDALEALKEDDTDADDDPETAEDEDDPAKKYAPIADEYGDEIEELAGLIAFRDAVNSDEWKYGIGFIRDSYFEDYARQYAEEIGAIDSDTGWPATHIDWEAAAEALQIDYTSVEYDGVTYWYR